jgi:hypothetical protein
MKKRKYAHREKPAHRDEGGTERGGAGVGAGQ